jgi:gamma-glutamylcyclotransferase (GGCT)/AIG2-like uncharacterized protein YtfP
MDVFVYGTLLDPHQTAAVLGQYEYGPDATIEGLHQVEGEYPTLAPGGEVEGAIVRTPEMEALDRYEGVGDGLYVRVSVPSADGGTVEAYVGDPDRLGVDVEWPGSGSFAERVERYVESEAVVRLE